MTLTFVDTNIIAYARDLRQPVKQALAEAWMKGLAAQRAGRISTQVLLEFYSVATHPAKLALPAAAARADCRALQAWHPLGPDLALLESAWSLSDRYDFSWWDALIVAAALRQECTLLLSEDLQHNLVVDDRLTIIDPFAPDAPPPPLAS